MNTFKSFVLAASLAAALGCGQSKPSATADGGPGQGGTGGAAGQGGTGGAAGQPGDAGTDTGADAGLTLVNWVNDLTQNHNNEMDMPDTVDDKVGTIIDTDDPTAFDTLLGKQAQ
ncbi:MAG TPA: hypothetical protein VMU50_13740 [Polyangia bacterium]|nr:hypothetical protein [Polyangia bacterium]